MRSDRADVRRKRQSLPAAIVGSEESLIRLTSTPAPMARPRATSRSSVGARPTGFDNDEIVVMEEEEDEEEVVVVVVGKDRERERGRERGRERIVETVVDYEKRPLLVYRDHPPPAVPEVSYAERRRHSVVSSRAPSRVASRSGRERRDGYADDEIVVTEEVSDLHSRLSGRREASRGRDGAGVSRRGSFVDGRW